MADRIRIQVQFRKAWWMCPSCGQEDYEDFNVAGGNTYEHHCSHCNAWFNNFKEYNGCLSFSPEEYDKLAEKDISDAKTIIIDKWVYDVKNPPPYVEPTKAQLEAEKEQKLQEIASLDTRIVEAQSKEAIK